MHQVGACKAGLYVAALKADFMRHVVATWVDARRLFVHRFVGRQDGGQLFILDANQVQRISGDLFRYRGDGSHLFAAIAHHAFGQYGTLFVMRPPQLRGRVVTGEHRAHARQRQGRAGVDRDNARVRIRAAKHLAMQHAGAVDVAGVHRAAQHLGARRHLRGLAADGRCAIQGVVGSVGCHSDPLARQARNFAAGSIARDAQFADRLAHHFVLTAIQLRQHAGRPTFGQRAIHGELLGHFGLMHDGVQLLVQQLDDGLRRALGREEAVP